MRLLLYIAMAALSACAENPTAPEANIDLAQAKAAAHARVCAQPYAVRLGIHQAAWSAAAQAAKNPALAAMPYLDPCLE